jgi:DNA-binding NarL/FixJ family response regulator
MRDAVQEGRAALRAGEGSRAREAFEAASVEEETGEVLEGLAEAAYLEHAYRDAIDTWEAAYEAYRREGDGAGAVRVARILGFMHGSVAGDFAVMSGWVARASSLLAEQDPSVEAGWVALTRGMFDADREHKEERFGEALTTARAFADPTLEFLALAYLGASRVHGDSIDEGMALLDEAAAATAGREVDDLIAYTEIFCQLFSACEYAHDVDRADQWIRVGEEIAARRNIPAVAAFCRTHYGGLLTAAGRWAEADDALTEAVRLWDLGHRTLRSGALVRLANLRVRQGRFEEAEQLLQGLEVDVDAAVPLALVHLAQGESELAIDVIEQALREVEPACTAAAPLWAALVDAHLAAASVDDARAAADRLDACVAANPGPYLRALAALAQGQLGAAVAAGDASERFREALTGFAKARTPMEVARARLGLAAALASDRPEVARAEARAALDEFERLPAARYADEAAALLRQLGAGHRAPPKEVGVLSKRETDVLELLGLGLSNPEIADRLFISRKTVEHHVSRILMKLGLRSRAEAAAYATRAGLGRGDV